MNIVEDVERAEATTRAVRTFAELEADSKSGEEFVGINDVTSGDDTETEDNVESDEPIDMEKLKVSLLYSLKYCIKSSLTGESCFRKPTKRCRT